jgi:hypothetical protein
MTKCHDFLRGRPILVGLGPMAEVYRKIQGCEDNFIHGLLANIHEHDIFAE